jgi:hypothetical protein
MKTKPEPTYLYLTGRANPKYKTQKVMLTSQQLSRIFLSHPVFGFVLGHLSLFSV